MEFQFNVNQYFKRPIVEIGNTLLPPEFAGDRRELWNTVNKVAEVVNEMGEASAHAQGLNKPITTAERLRQSDQNIYLLIDRDSNNGNGAVTGMLKIGRKGLYVFDRQGQHYQVTPPCVLDFYVHEKRQRSGLGKKLFEYMLEKEDVKPHNLAIDRPSEKFLNFLNKHYNLRSPIKQMNNYVVYDGFFPEGQNKEEPESSPLNRTNGLQSSQSPNTQPLYGRYGAPRPPCSMGQIIHNTTAQKSSEPTSPNNFGLSSDVTKNQYQQMNIVQSSPNQEQQNVLSHNEAALYSQHPLQNSVPRSVQQEKSNVNSSQQKFIRNPQEVENYQNQLNAFQNQQSFMPNQIRMFPEKENMSQNNQTIGGVWPGQCQPQQVFQMSQSPPNAPGAQSEFTRYSPLPSNEHPQQVVSNGNQQTNFSGSQQYANSPYVQQNIIPQQHQINNQINQPIDPRNYQFSGNIPHQQNFHFPEHITDSRTPYHPNQGIHQIQQNLNGVPPESQFIQQSNQFENPIRNENTWSNQYHPQSQPMIYSQNLQARPAITNDQAVTNQYPQTAVTHPSLIQTPNQQNYNQYPQYINNQQIHPPTPDIEKLIPHPQPVHTQRQNYQEKLEYIPPRDVIEKPQENEEENLKNQTETVQSLLQVDPKYFKPDPIHVKQPSHNIQSNLSQRARQKDTVASLINAEQEVFENGLLREEFRVPLHPAFSEKYPHVGYPRQVMQQDDRHHVSQTKLSPVPPRFPNRSPNAQYAQQQTHYQMMPHSQQVEGIYHQNAPHDVRSSQMQLQPVRSRSNEQELSRQAEIVNQNQPAVPVDTEIHPLPQTEHFNLSASNLPTQMAPTNQYPSQRQTTSQSYIPIEQYKPSQAVAPIEQNLCERRDSNENRIVQNNAEYIQPQQKMSRETKEPIGFEENPSNAPIEQPVVGIDKPKDISANEVHYESQPDTIRQSSYIPNEFTVHPEGQRMSPNSLIKSSNEDIITRKKEISRQYGLNDVDMRRKGYKSAIIKRPTDVQELETLEYGYPPQITKNVTKPPEVTDSVRSSPKLERPKSLEIQTEVPFKEPQLPPEMPSVDETDGMNNEPELEKLTLKDISTEPPENNENESGKKTPRHLTDQGYFDLKFYHNKLW